MLEDQEICMLSPDWFLEVMKNPVYSRSFISGLNCQSCGKKIGYHQNHSKDSIQIKKIALVSPDPDDTKAISSTSSSSSSSSSSLISCHQSVKEVMLYLITNILLEEKMRIIKFIYTNLQDETPVEKEVVVESSRFQSYMGPTLLSDEDAIDDDDASNALQDKKQSSLISCHQSVKEVMLYLITNILLEEKVRIIKYIYTNLQDETTPVEKEVVVESSSGGHQR
jgi:hypothetical protein